ncbi:MAG: phosphoglucosamine mutase [Elusimicrobia bacterium GWA2_64_40]|nr:MAG: phosphoglucosamine mutase [Elusimicrobia bacterium GWA2_64_40]OGR64516.1 MAG: phosphoglucosamine mutase [Elusimicrobia bacterium GWB2_63_16]HAN04230.1 phosphoglucosamine mutase [Elusimicrobiota bacterium]
MGKLFGTDGIRGITWDYPFTPDFIRKIGYAASLVLPKYKKKGHAGKPVVLIGMDSRASGRLIKKYLVEGLGASKFKVVDLGIIPTPAVSYLVKRENADFGIVISASHNPPEFNGIKFFSSDGLKLNDAIENKIEKLLLGKTPLKFRPSHPGLHKKDFTRDYEDFLKCTLPPGFSLKGLKILLDCANGAAYKIAPRVFRDLGAKVKVIGDKPDGKNINMGCGALHTEKMAAAAAKWGAFCGISFDGDADRCMFADEKGYQLDGDDVIAMAAPYMKARGRLTNNGVSLTFMSNCGLLKYLRDQGISVAEVPVGDKNVTDAMERGDLKLGGETSGHIIFREFAPTGDGILTALQTLAAVRDMGKPFSWFRRHWSRYPQVVEKVKVSSKPDFGAVPGFSEKLSKLEGGLKGNGRIFIRYSGTEPLLRLLVEGESRGKIKAIADDLLEHYRRHSGAVAAR